jgi:heterotetrameric sarcosine oxidase delta subunit
MMQLTCPYCGPRDSTEFTYSGDATVRRPADPLATPLDVWCDHIYLRDNPRGPHNELWQHSSGCRRFIQVRRDTLTHDVLAVGLPGETLA